MAIISEIKFCEVCGNTNLITVLNLGNHPLCDDLVPIGEERICLEYPIEILFCSVCLTAHQRYQIEKKHLFPNTYHYRSRFTSDVLNGMSSFVNECEKRLSSLANKTVLDIGCNDGSLLDFFHKKGSTTIGIEPTSAYADAKAKSIHTIYNDYFSTELAEKILRSHGQPDVISFTNVFAHIENLPNLLSALKLLTSKTTMIAIENHYLGAVLEHNQFDTFYHEHPRTYSYSSFKYISESLDKQISHVQFPARYGGNIRVFLGNTKDENPNHVSETFLQKEKTYLKQFELMDKNIKQWQHEKKHFIQQYVKVNGPMAAKAFPGRAAILIKMLELTESDLYGVFEKPGSVKIGNYVPGTRIPILSDDEFFDRSEKPNIIINLAWHISGEIRSYLTENGYRGSIINILEREGLRVPA